MHLGLSWLSSCKRMLSRSLHVSLTFFQCDQEGRPLTALGERQDLIHCMNACRSTKCFSACFSSCLDLTEWHRLLICYFLAIVGNEIILLKEAVTN